MEFFGTTYGQVTGLPNHEVKTTQSAVHSKHLYYRSFLSTLRKCISYQSFALYKARNPANKSLTAKHTWFYPRSVVIYGKYRSRKKAAILLLFCDTPGQHRLTASKRSQKYIPKPSSNRMVRNRHELLMFVTNIKYNKGPTLGIMK